MPNILNNVRIPRILSPALLVIINTNGQKYSPIFGQFLKAAVEKTVWYKAKLMMGSMKELSPEIRYPINTKFHNSKSELTMLKGLHFFILCVDLSKGERLSRT